MPISTLAIFIFARPSLLLVLGCGSEVASVEEVIRSLKLEFLTIKEDHFELMMAGTDPDQEDSISFVYTLQLLVLCILQILIFAVLNVHYTLNYSEDVS